MPAKPRGLRRKCVNMVRAIAAQTASFPAPHGGRDFWHGHLPVARELVGAHAPFEVRRLGAQTLLDCAFRLTKLAPDNQMTRVVVALNAGEFWLSQIIVFFGDAYYDRFFERNSPSQMWTPLAPSRSLAREWNLKLPDDFAQRGVREILDDADLYAESELWFFGQISD